MKNQNSTLKNEKEMKEHEAGLNAQIAFTEAMSQWCAKLKEELVCIREYPDFLEIFSREEVVEINLLERRIPQEIKYLRALRYSISLENRQSVENGTTMARIDEMEAIIKEMSAFVKGKASRITEPKIEVLFWLRRPFEAMSLFITGFIRRKKKEKRRRELATEGEERRKKKEK